MWKTPPAGSVTADWSKGGSHACRYAFLFGPRTSELVDRVSAASDEVEGLLRGVKGFVSYTLFRTDDGGVTVTVCQDKAGTDESLGVARDWVAANASDIGVGAPTVAEGPVGMHLSS